MDFFKNKFDLIVSIGENCACTSYLRRCYLQAYSYPFDWLTHADFATRIDLLAGDFADFLNFDDLQKIGTPTAANADKDHDVYVNNRTSFYHLHDFPSGVPLDESYGEVKAKYDRRIARFYRTAERSSRILLVWFSHSQILAPEDIDGGLRKLQEKFPGKEIFMLIIENSPENSLELRENARICIVHQDTASDDRKYRFNQLMGNKSNNLKLFRKLKLKTSVSGKIKKYSYIFCKTVVALLPGRKLRQSTGKKLKMLFYHAKL